MKWYELQNKIYGVNEVKTVVRVYEKDGSYWIKNYRRTRKYRS